MRLPLAATAFLFSSLVVTQSAHAQMIACAGDDNISTAGALSGSEWIQVKAGSGCEMTIELGGKQRSLESVRISEKPKLGVAGATGKHRIAYKSNGTPGRDRFGVAIGIIGVNGTPVLVRRVVEVTVTP